LLCELYLFDFIFPNNSRWNPNPHVGDVHLRAFSSHVYNQVLWKEASQFHENVEDNYAVFI
jgi:hypothetical protein